MYLFLLGNGFDLHYKLPTSYNAFLKTVDYLLRKTASGEKLTSVAQVFGDKQLQNADSQIRDCIEKYGADYDAPFGDEVSKLVTLAKNNFWFSYLKKSAALNNNWVDFENEVARVIHTLERNIPNAKTKQGSIPVRMRCFIRPENKGDAYILSKLDVFESQLYGDETRDNYLAEDYTCADPPGSENFVGNWEKVSEHFSASLRDLSEMLALYLQIFIEAPLDNLIHKDAIQKDLLLDNVLGGVVTPDGKLARILGRTGFVVTFNYTRTCELLYPNTQFESYPTHIHGSLKNTAIVLGINADKTDENVPVDTTFLSFKKYYQRILHGTSQSFLELCAKEDRGPLYVIGHSLDETDQEIFMELFHLATSITIFCHKPEAKAEYLHKLTRVYTKSGLESLYKDKNLRFVDIALLNDKNFVEKEGLACVEANNPVDEDLSEYKNGYLFL